LIPIPNIDLAKLSSKPLKPLPLLRQGYAGHAGGKHRVEFISMIDMRLTKMNERAAKSIFDVYNEKTFL
jgi:hypothetical protein